MNGQAAILKDPDVLPGWFGKLPGIGDFAHRRLPDAFRAAWDAWLQEGLAGLRQRHADWTARYLEGPVWFFVLARDVAGPASWIGVLMPSVDGVGRYFPFAVAAELRMPAAVDASIIDRWWQAAAQAALDGLEQDLDAAQFDVTLARCFDAARDAEAGGAAGADAVRVWPAAGQSLWLAGAGDGQSARVLCAGLPRGTRFDRLFGFPEAELDGAEPA